jgi:hypothetical protein
VKLVNNHVHKSGEMLYLDLECVQNIIQSLEFSPMLIDTQSRMARGAYLSDSDKPFSDDERTPLPRQLRERLPSCCSTPRYEKIHLSAEVDEEETGVFMPSQQSISRYVFCLPFSTNGAVLNLAVKTKNPYPRFSIQVQLLVLAVCIGISATLVVGWMK